MVKINNKFSAVAGIIAVCLFIVSILLTAKYSHSFQNWYTTNEYFDWHTMAISHFGVSNLALPFTLIVCLTSLLVIYFMLGIKNRYGNKGLMKRGSSWIITGFIALMLAFISLLYEPNSTFSIAFHFLVATIYFVCIPIGMMMLGVYFIKNKLKFGFTSLILGLIAFVFGPIICMGSSIFFGDKGVAIPEFIQIVLEGIWILLLAIDILKKDGKTFANQ